MLRLVIASLLAATPLSCKDSSSGSGGGGDADAEPGGKSGGGKTLSGACDESKLGALTGSLRGADRPRRRDLVVTHLTDACKVPEPVAAYLQLYAADLGPAAQGGRAAVPPTSAFQGSVERICGETDLVELLPKARGKDRPGLIYDQCKLSRFDLMDRESFVRGGVASMAPWHAYEWLLEQGVAPGDAKPIALGLYDAGKERWAKPGQTLPKVEGALPSVPSGPRIFVTNESLMFDERTLAAVDGDGNLEPAAVKNHLVGALFDLIAEEADKAKAMAGPGEWEARAVLAFDEGTSFATMVNVMYTIGRAEYQRYAILARGDHDEVGALAIEPPRFDFPGVGAAEPGPRLKVFILEDDGFRVMVASQDSSTMIPRKDGALDFAALADAARAHRAEHGAALAVVSGENTIPAGEFVRTGQALVGPGCGAGQECVLGGLIIEAGAG